MHRRDPKTGRMLPWTAESFFASLRPTPQGCLIFTGYIEKKSGYGRTEYKGRRIGAHQLAWILAGRKPWRGHKFELAHSCHNRPCCNLEHLSKKTSSQNKMMSSRDGRLPHAKTHKRYRAKLTRTDVLEIKKFIAEGVPLGEIAASYGVTRPNISQIKRGYSWKDGQF